MPSSMDIRLCWMFRCNSLRCSMRPRPPTLPRTSSTLTTRSRAFLLLRPGLRRVVLTRPSRGLGLPPPAQLQLTRNRQQLRDRIRHKSPGTWGFCAAVKITFNAPETMRPNRGNKFFAHTRSLWKKMWITFGKRAKKSLFHLLPTASHSDRRRKMLFIN